MDDTTSRPSLAVWLEAARPRTLPASVAPVLVGTAASLRVAGRVAEPPATSLLATTDSVSVAVVPFLLALLVALALQVAVNYANDYFDGVGGIDTPDRLGPRRAVASGMVAPDQMKAAMLATLAVAGVAGFALAAMVGWELLLVGALALLAAVGYSGGPKPYASAGLGEAMVFVFFGLVATIGSAYAQDAALSWLPVAVAVPMGCLATALLVVNNLRDIPTDEVAGKVTLAVRLGPARTGWLYLVLVAIAYLACVLLVAVTGHGWYLLPLLSVPMAWRAIELVRHAPTRLVEALGRTAQAQLVFAALLTVALVLRT